MTETVKATIKKYGIPTTIQKIIGILMFYDIHFEHRITTNLFSHNPEIYLCSKNLVESYGMQCYEWIITGNSPEKTISFFYHGELICEAEINEKTIKTIVDTIKSN